MLQQIAGTSRFPRTAAVLHFFDFMQSRRFYAIPDAKPRRAFGGVAL
jgi:hypothetical protein